MEAKRILIQGSASANLKGLKSFDLPDEQWLDPSKIVAKKFIARGAYGSVYRGRYDEQDVAIKVLDWGEDDQSMETLMLRKAFRDEVTVWCDLDHANISKFVGATLGTCTEIKSRNQDEPKNMCCLVTEFQRSGTLKSYLRKHRQKKLNLKTIIRLSIELAKGLSYLHSENVVHRDIKPENILLNKEKTVKICDFGIARPEASNQYEMSGYQIMKKSKSGVAGLDALNHSKMTEQTGTIGYMAPEVFAGESYTRKCDVYSFGICLWEIYCCNMAYKFYCLDENTYPDLYKSVRPNIPIGCPESLANLMKRCWKTNPDERPEMEEVVSILEAIDTSRKRWFGCWS